MTRDQREMKDSGVEWLGKIPWHWDVWKLSHAFKQISSGTTPNTDDLRYFNGNVSWVTTSELRENRIASTKSNVTKLALQDYPTLKVYPPGTLLIAMYGATIGRLGILEIPACTNQACCALSDSHVLDTEFGFYCLYVSRNHIIQQSFGGGQPNINQETIRSLRVPLPPLNEQRAIASYLDTETARIDKLIAKTERLNALLREKRTALISRAVTKGLDAGVAMKDSGVEWLGEIPCHWVVKRLKHVTTYTGSGKTPKGGSEIYKSSGVLFLRSQNVHFEGLRLSDVAFISHEIDSEMRSTRVKANDVLLNITGASLGRCSVVPHDFPAANVNQHVCIVRPFRHHVDSELLNYSMASDVVQSQIFSTENGSSREGITFQQIRDFWIALPRDLAEQRAIANYLDRETAKIDKLIAKNDRLIALLREKRVALISAAVTGKISAPAVESGTSC